MLRKLLIGILLLTFSPAVFAKKEVMFEGYFKINVGEKHVGYTVQRYEFDSKKKQFHSVYYIQTSPEAGGINESLEAVADDKFQPVSYSYTTKVGDSIKLIDAKFEKGVMTATIGNGKVSQKVQKKLAPGTFLSTFLAYLMLQKGYEVGKKYSYQAIAEENAEVYPGEALIKETLKFKGKDALRILNSYKGSQFVSYVSPKGEIFGTTSPVQKITTELVTQPAEATQGLMVPTKTLKKLFHTFPRGGVHPFASNVETKNSEPSQTTKTEAPTKEIKKTEPAKTPKKGK